MARTTPTAASSTGPTHVVPGITGMTPSGVKLPAPAGVRSSAFHHVSSELLPPVESLRKTSDPPQPIKAMLEVVIHAMTIIQRASRFGQEGIGVLRERALQDAAPNAMVGVPGLRRGDRGGSHLGP